MRLGMNDNISNIKPKNIDAKTVSGFGSEWTSFTQAGLSQQEKKKIFEDYFDIFPWHLLPEGGGNGVDVGCGSGRWASIIAPLVANLHLVDASAAAIQVAKTNLTGFKKVQFHHASVDTMPIPNGSLDFAYSLGVLHHVPDTQQSIISIATKLKSGAPFLVYLYYAFDNRPFWYRCLWHLTEAGRFSIARLPYSLRYVASQLISIMVYWPMARLAKILEYFNSLPGTWPLTYYRDKSFYVMRTDALDRFGTRLEQRFTREQIKTMLEVAGFEDIKFSDHPPYWCVVGIKS